MTLKNRGQPNKTEGRTGPKNKGGSLAVGTYLQRDSAPPPPPGWKDHIYKTFPDFEQGDL